MLLDAVQRLGRARLLAGQVWQVASGQLTLLRRTLQDVESQIAGDGEQPGVELRTAGVEAGQVRLGAQKSLLRHVFCLRLPHAHAAQKAKQRTLVGINQFSKGALIARGNALQKRLSAQVLLRRSFFMLATFQVRTGLSAPYTDKERKGYRVAPVLKALGIGSWVC